MKRWKYTKRLFHLVVIFGLMIVNTTEGRKRKSDQRYIVGGTDATADDAKYTVYVKVRNAACTGSLIHQNFVITAKHCTTNFVPDDYLLHFDKVDYATDGNQNRTVSVIHRHDVADVAILEMSEPVELNDQVAIIEPKCDAIMAIDDTCRAVGWGYIVVGTFPDKLQAAEVKRVRNRDCPWAMNVHRYCVYGNPTTRQNICNGDSGGPCMKDGKLYGVASGGPTGCPTTNPYGDFVRIFSKCDWINGILPATTEPTTTAEPMTTVASTTTTAHPKCASLSGRKLARCIRREKRKKRRQQKEVARGDRRSYRRRG